MGNRKINTIFCLDCKQHISPVPELTQQGLTYALPSIIGHALADRRPHSLRYATALDVLQIEGDQLPGFDGNLTGLRIFFDGKIIGTPTPQLLVMLLANRLPDKIELTVKY